MTDNISLVCGTSSFYLVYLVLAFIYKFILHGVGLILAFLTRNIQIDVLNDYYYNTAIIIISSVLMLLIAFPTIILADDYTGQKFFWAFLLFTGTTTYLGLTFLPKV